MLGSISLERNFAVGTIKTKVFNARRLSSYLGFEIYPNEEGKSLSLVYDGKTWSYQAGVWVEGGWSTPDQIRIGLPQWNSPLQFLIKLSRKPNGTSPLIDEIRFGFHANGHVLSYVLNFCIPQLLSKPVTLHRWVDLATDPVVGVNSARVSQRVIKDFGEKSDLSFKYILPVKVIDSADCPIDETPILLLHQEGTENERYMNEVDSIRFAPEQAMLSETYATCDHRVQGTVIAQSGSDYIQSGEALEIAEQLISVLNQGFVNAPAYGMTFGIFVYPRITSDSPGNIKLGLLPAASFEFLIKNIPMLSTSTEVGVLQEIGSLEFGTIT